MPDNLLMPEGSDPYYGQRFMPSQTMTAYQPTLRDRLASWLMGDQKASPERNMLVEGFTGSRGMGTTGMGLLDATPAGVPFAVQDAYRSGDDRQLAMALMPGAPKGVGAVENGTAKAARNASQELENYLKQNLGVFSANAPYTPKPRQLDPNAPTSLNDLDAMVRAAFGKKPDEPVSVEPPGIRAYHGSPHDFDKFDMSRIGTGEGAQAYGHGLYFAEAEDVAKQYRKNLSAADGGIDQIAQTLAEQAGGWDKARQKFEGELLGRAQKMRDAGLKYDLPDYDVATLQALRKGEPGRLYEVRINASPDDFLDWDKPLSAQSEKVRGALQESTSSQRLNHALSGYTDTLGDDALGQAAPQKANGFINGPSSGVVRQGMGAMVNDSKVLNPVVGLVPVDMMNVLGSQKGASKVGGHDPSMLLSKSPIDRGDAVSLGVGRSGSAEAGVARATAEGLGGDLNVIGMPPELRSALGTGKLNQARALGDVFPKDDNTSKWLNSQGIVGIKYLDQGSRSAGEGSRNYVVFRDDIIDIVKKYGIAAAASMYGMDAVNNAMGAANDQPQNLLMQGY